MSRKLQQLQGSIELKGIKATRGVKVVNHAQFADNTILLGGVSTIIAQRFNGVLSNFIKASDGKVNSENSKVYGWNCPPGNMERIGRILRFKGNVA